MATRHDSAEKSSPASRTDAVHAVVVDVAGVAVRVESNSAQVLELVRARFHVAGRSRQQSLLTILQQQAPIAGPGTPTWSFPGPDAAEVAMRGLQARVYLAERRAEVAMNASVLQQEPVFRRCVLEGIPFSLLTRCDRFPVHAGAIRRGEMGILLRADSGVGKSTLLYAAHRAGIAVLADDACRIQLDAGVRIWGDTPAPRIHLLEDARDRFPELRGLSPAWMSATGMKLEVPLAPQDGAAPFVLRARVCLLTRQAGAGRRPPVLHRVPPDRIVVALREPDSRLDVDRGARDRVASELSAGGGWHLELSDDPAEAVPHLLAMLDEMPNG